MNLSLFENVYPGFIHLVVSFGLDTKFKPITMLAEIKKELNGIFKAIPTITSMSNELPEDYPRIVLTEEKTGQYFISYTKAELILNFSENIECFNTVATNIKKFINFFYKSNIKVSKLGLIIKCDFCESLNIDILKSRYIVSDKLKNINQLDIAWHKEIEFKGSMYNRWVRVFFFQSAGGLKNLMVDINTIYPEIKSDEIDKLVEYSFEELKNNLNQLMEW